MDSIIKKDRRDVSISIARLVAMLLIVLCHMFSYYDIELARWFNVGVQVFFVISGFLYGSKDIYSPIEFFKRNSIKILIPYWIFLLSAIILYIVFCPHEINLVFVIKAFFCAGTIKGLGHLWFVGYILFCYFITPYLFWLRKYVENYSYKKKTVVYVNIVLFVQLVSFLFNSFFEPDRVSCYIIGFFLADLFKSFSTKGFYTVKWLFIIVAFFMNMGEIYIKYIGNIDFEVLSCFVFKVYCRYSHVFLGVAIFLLFYKQFSNRKYFTILKLSDKYSYTIYLVHQLFILSPLSLMALFDIQFVSWIVVVVSILLSSIILYRISKWTEVNLSKLINH